MSQQSVNKVRAGVEWLAGSLGAALVTAFGDPTPPRSRRLPILSSRRVDLAVAADVVLVVVLYGAGAATLIDLNNELMVPYPPQFMHLLAAACSLPLLLRQRWPVAAWRSGWLVLIGVSVPLSELSAVPFVPPAIVMYLLCLYSVASRSEPQVAAGAWVISVVTLFVTQLVSGAGTADPGVVLGGGVLISVPVLLGYNVRARRQVQRKLAAQERRNEEEQAARAMLQERSRIARELHDVVAHHMSVIAIQAEAAPLQVPDAPEALKTHFAEIRATSLEALTEMRRILGILRDGDAHGDTAPQPGLDRLDDLVANAHAGGLAVTTRVSGHPLPVPSAVGLSVYRIVQESLSNAMRHAPGSSVEVEIGYQRQPAAVRVRVENAAPPGGPEDVGKGARHGLVGMRERAAMLGGELSAGPAPGGGFAVVAVLPLEEA